jgi:hypothetical protein
MKKQVTMPPEVRGMVEAEQRKVRSRLVNYDDSDAAPEGDMGAAEQVEEETHKKRGRPRKGTTIQTKVKRKVEVAAEDAETRPKRFLTEIERQAGGDTAKMRELLTKRFVPLVDILPPLPRKGDFDIELIKQSPYFFS